MPIKRNAPKESPARHAIILAGGSGTRLWPLSRNLFPKQLLALNGELTLLQQTVRRVLTAFAPQNVWVVTNEEHVFEVRSQLRSLNPVLDAHVLAEPLARNTLPAVLLGLDRIVPLEDKAADESLVAVFPSDHLLEDLEGFRSSLNQAMGLAARGLFVTFGVLPRKPETGYGYIARGKQLEEGGYEVESFIEKPKLEKAVEFLKSGRHYWNSGVFVFRAREFLSAVAAHTPELWSWWSGRGAAALVSGYGALPNLSVDYGIAEKIEDIAVVEARFDWDDLGNWEAIYRLGKKDEAGNVIQGDVLAMDCRDCLLISKGGKLAVVGLRGMIMIQTRDATLTCPLTDVQRVKEVVALLKSQGSQLVESHLTVKRPWGSYSVLEEGQHYKIKRIEVLAGARLSLQMHHHRSEHWVVVSGTALVEIDGVERLLVENQAVDIAKATTHRLANPGKVPLEIIEIQSGPYLEEDDIVRFDDVYGRVKQENS
ncbi:MAG: mannose-1-phosphate guanylyltransferase/mannose-6-phosphate isomerase [Humidesulfovibrio sp.]|uniref:mannose-1-phosphate guanylyltransferase/mannose-6-phosphate isomerase n=1 Tax=Humidesulfovibrio sp. TaxID=2910988 RepID=UPI002733F5FB|nr:mannose-1-phosphate guanylyltransferase/mannose-6-phosphate isomerase [Humidesulfovibrio sp.]MDP2846758.1 mannose-1-phosphate guanylyltransferase/mannose-6-phosphate isomerase [Humidesulfovibrio sp.]